MNIPPEDPEVQRWVHLFRELIALNYSAALIRAGEIVFSKERKLRPALAQKSRHPKSGLTKKKYVAENDHDKVHQMVYSINRQMQLNAFLITHPELKEVDIYNSIDLDRRDWRRWKLGLLPDSSVMTKRIAERLGLP